MNTALRILGVLALIGVMAFCVFGFLATYELGISARYPWQRGYAFGGLASLIGVVLLLRPRCRRNSKT